MSLVDTMPPVLDACCGSKMFWFDREDKRAVFVDVRREAHTLKDKSSSGGSRELVIDPDIKADFRKLPFENETFSLVIFDPPHLVRAGKRSWLALKYGKLENDWQDDLRRGFAECFRVLKHEGTLIFKWNEDQIKVSEVLALTPERPLVGNRCGRTAKSHWLVFHKINAKADGIDEGDSVKSMVDCFLCEGSGTEGVGSPYTRRCDLCKGSGKRCVNAKADRIEVRDSVEGLVDRPLNDTIRLDWLANNDAWFSDGPCDGQWTPETWRNAIDDKINNDFAGSTKEIRQEDSL